MRVRADQTMPVFFPGDPTPHPTSGVRAYLDGVEVANCIAADSDEGWVEVVESDANGVGVFDGISNFKRNVHRGKVEVRPLKG